MEPQIKKARTQLYKSFVLIYLKSMGLLFLSIPIILTVCVVFDLLDSPARVLMELTTGLFIGLHFVNPRLKEATKVYEDSLKVKNET